MANPTNGQVRAPAQDFDDMLVPDSTVKKDYFGGASDMWLWRRETTDPTFPKAIRIANRKFRRRGQLRAWIKAREEASQIEAQEAKRKARSSDRATS